MFLCLPSTSDPVFPEFRESLKFRYGGAVEWSGAEGGTDEMIQRVLLLRNIYCSQLKRYPGLVIDHVNTGSLLQAIIHSSRSLDAVHFSDETSVQFRIRLPFVSRSWRARWYKCLFRFQADQLLLPQKSRGLQKIHKTM